MAAQRTLAQSLALDSQQLAAAEADFAATGLTNVEPSAADLQVLNRVADAIRDGGAEARKLLDRVKEQIQASMSSVLSQPRQQAPTASAFGAPDAAALA